MEILIFALIASYNTHGRQERVVCEPEEFRPFDLQALRNSANDAIVGWPKLSRLSYWTAAVDSAPDHDSGNTALHWHHHPVMGFGSSPV